MTVGADHDMAQSLCMSIVAWRTHDKESGVMATDVCSVELADVLDVKPCVDPSLPEGHAFWLALHSQPQGLFFVSGTAAVYNIQQRGLLLIFLIYALGTSVKAWIGDGALHAQSARRMQRPGWMGCSWRRTSQQAGSYQRWSMRWQGTAADEMPLCLRPRACIAP